MTQKQIENRSLCYTAIENLVVTFAGIWAYRATGIQALFLDFFYSFLAFFSVISAIVISRLSKKKTPHYPDGVWFIEPLYAILKAFAILILLVYSVVETSTSAWQYFAHGIGSPMIIGPVIPYSIIVGLIKVGMGLYNSFQNKKIHNTSTVLAVEAKSNFVDSLQSFACGIAAVILKFIAIDGGLGFLHYTGDFFLTTILVIFSLKLPLVSLVEAFRELTGGTVSDPEIQQTVESEMQHELPDTPYRIYKTGMHIKVEVTLRNDMNAKSLEQIKGKILSDLHRSYEYLDVLYTR